MCLASLRLAEFQVWKRHVCFLLSGPPPRFLGAPAAAFLQAALTPWLRLTKQAGLPPCALQKTPLGRQAKGPSGPWRGKSRWTGTASSGTTPSWTTCGVGWSCSSWSPWISHARTWAKPTRNQCDLLAIPCLATWPLGPSCVSSGQALLRHSVVSREQETAYASAIRSLGEVMSVYDNDNCYPIYGFGAKIPPSHSAPRRFVCGEDSNDGGNGD